jgi:membrane-associated phospholipid phosphatase
MNYTYYNLFILYGRYIPFLAVLYSILFLFYKYNYKLDTLIKPVLYFLVFVGINNILNNVLKLIFKEPRPSTSKYTPIMYSDIYGLPSGHTQNMAFITTYFYLLYPNYTYLHLFNLMNTIITSIQRYLQHAHTIKQILAGIFVGGLFGNMIIM